MKDEFNICGTHLCGDGVGCMYETLWIDIVGVLKFWVIRSNHMDWGLRKWHKRV